MIYSQGSCVGSLAK